MGEVITSSGGSVVGGGSWFSTVMAKPCGFDFFEAVLPSFGETILSLRMIDVKSTMLFDT